MEKAKTPNLIKKENLRKYIGRPVWFQGRQSANEFGWAFIHPETLRLGYCKLILPNPGKKDFYSWDSVDLYDRPAIRGICSRCDWYRADQLVKCGKDGACCTYENKYKDFVPAPFHRDRGYTVETFLRQLDLAGYKGEKHAAN